MKVRESGLPDEKVWNDFFAIDSILSEMQINGQINDIVEVGCGYGTFTIPVAKQSNSRLFAFDIEKEMIDILEQKIKNERIDNIIPEHRDVLTKKTDLINNSIYKEPFIIEPYHFGLIISKF